MSAAPAWRRYAGGGALLLLSLAVACQRDLKPRERARIYSWLQCEECVDGELAAVKALGTGWRTGKATVDSLSDDLLAGPSAQRRANVEHQFLVSFKSDSAEAILSVLPSVLPVTSTEYVRHYQDNFVNLFRIRAAIALARIGGSKATAVLDSAVAKHFRTQGDTLRPDAQLDLLFVRDSILGGP